MALFPSDLPGKWTIIGSDILQGEPIQISEASNEFLNGRHCITGIAGFLPVVIILPKEHFHEFGPDPSTKEHRN